jgi:hypothetical protein
LALVRTPRVDPQHGTQAASALASLKRLERDRINAMPANDRPLG